MPFPRVAGVTHAGALQFEVLQHQLPQGCKGYVPMIPQEAAELGKEGPSHYMEPQATPQSITCCGTTHLFSYIQYNLGLPPILITSSEKEVLGSHTRVPGI